MIDYSYEQIFQKHGKTFCAAPWSSFWTFPDGNVAPCCKIDLKIGNLNDTSLKDLENSPELIKLRKQFLNGEKPVECKSCWEREATGITSNQPRAYANKCASNTIEKALNNTNQDGTINKFYPTWLDLLWTTKCNFACNICNPYTSTSIKKDIPEFNLLHDKSYETRPQTQNYNNIINYVLENPSTLEHLHFGGGEPFMQNETYDLLDKMIEGDLDQTIGLHFHTNGSVTNTYKGTNIVDQYLSKWRSDVRITMSHDHFGERGFYSRYGYNEEKWLKNYFRFKDAGINVMIQTTLSVYNIASLDLLIDWYVKNLGSDWKNNFGLCQSPKSLSFEQLNINENYRYKISKSLDRAIDTCRSIGRHQEARELDNRKKLFLNSNAKFNLHKSFYQGTMALDKKRNLNFSKTFPELRQFLTYCKNSA